MWCCLWYMITRTDESWFMNMDFIWVGEQRKQAYFPGNFTRQYLLYIYQSFYFLTGGEVVPQSNGNSVF